MPHRSLLALASFVTISAAWLLAAEAPQPVAPKPAARDRYKDDLAGNKEVEEIIKSFQGKGAVGDDSEPTPAARAVKIFQVRPGFEMELLAAEPAVQQPLYMSFDHRGRLWVVQYLQYPFPAGLKVIKYDQYLRAVFDKVPPPPPNHIPGADKITVFEDTNGDGSYDKVKDVITGLNIVSSVVTGRGGIWVLNPPYLLFYPDRNGDDVPDGEPEVCLSGFGLEDTHSVANSLRWGPDGWLYGANGSTTTGTVSSAATKNVSFKGQMIWRYHPDTKVFEIFAEGGGNTFSLEMDAVGRVFSGTNAGSTRGMHYVQGGYAEKNWGKHGPLTNPYAFGYYGHMKHQGLNERFSQTFMIYEGGKFPGEYDHTVISANSLHNRVTASTLLNDTSSYRTIDLDPLVTTPDRWFRPVDIKLGPDGAVYLADWYDSRLTHVDPRDNWHKSSGRLYRLKAAGAKPLAPFDLSKSSNAELLAYLGHENRWFREHAVAVLGERQGKSVVPQLARLAQDAKNPHALEALWALNLCGGLSGDLAAELLEHPSQHVRRWTVRLLGDDRQVSSPLAAQLARLAASEPEVQIRSQLASSAKRLPAEQGLPIAQALAARSEDLDDMHLPLLIWWAIEAQCESHPDAVLHLFSDASFWRLPIVERYVVERVMQRFATAGGERDLQNCAQLLSLSPNPELSAKLMSGLLEAFRGRKMTGLPPSLAAALDKHQKSLGESDLALGLRLGKADAVDKALKFILDEKADKPLRLSYIEILGQINQPRAVPELLKLLGATRYHSVKRTALEALMQYDDPTIGPKLARLYHGALPDEQGVRSTAQRVLASRKTWAKDLLGEVQASRVSPREIPLDIVQQIKLHHDAELDKIVEKHWGKVRESTPKEKLEQIAKIALLVRQRDGDAAAGKAIFTKTCAVCHKLFGEGGQTGPELTGYERDNLGFLLPAIVDPSLAIREEFTNFLIVTTDGRTLTGLIDKQDARTVTLRGANNQTTLVNREDIDTLQALTTSIMPENILQPLSEQDLKNLFAYVLSRAPSASKPSGGN